MIWIFVNETIIISHLYINYNIHFKKFKIKICINTDFGGDVGLNALRSESLLDRLGSRLVGPSFLLDKDFFRNKQHEIFPI